MESNVVNKRGDVTMRRRKAREIAIQSLYRIEMNAVSAEDAVHAVMEQMRSESENWQEADDRALAFILKLVKGVREHIDRIDDIFSRHLQGWKLDRLSKVDLQVLRLAVFEMYYDNETPPKVAVNEAVDLAKAFGTEDSGKFVNGVLGKVLQQLGKVEN